MRQVTDSEFEALFEHYQRMFERYYRHLRVAKIDKDVFRSEFQYVLFRTMALFDLDKAKAETERFERYFVSALKKRCNSLKRASLTKKRKEEKHSISFCLKKHDIPDNRVVPILDQLAANEIVDFCSNGLNDRGVTQLRFGGLGVGETCERLNLSPQKYRAIMERVRENSLVNRVFSSN